MPYDLNVRRVLSWGVLFAFLGNSLLLPPAHAQQPLNLPAPGAMVALSSAYSPAMLKGVTVHKDNPFLFDFIVDTGEDKLQGEQLKAEGNKLIKYFLASLAIPEKDLWVNLSPYEKDRTIPEALSYTDMGKDLLAQDYILKQITASLIYPEEQLGKIFWDKVYSKAQALYGTTNIPVNTFNKVWIMADKAEVYEHNNSAFVTDSHLKVMLEEDYLALGKNGKAGDPKAGIQSQIIKEIILPQLENEVNHGKNFAPLRQIFNSLILAGWYKNSLKQTLLNQVYSNQEKVKGIDLQDKTIKEQIYQRYLTAYKKGVFNFIKEEPSQGTTIPRKYFSGGVDAAMAAHPMVTDDPVKLNGMIGPNHQLMALATGLKSPKDLAMASDPDWEKMEKDTAAWLDVYKRFEEVFYAAEGHILGTAPDYDYYKEFLHKKDDPEQAEQRLLELVRTVTTNIYDLEKVLNGEGPQIQDAIDNLKNSLPPDAVRDLTVQGNSVQLYSYSTYPINVVLAEIQKILQHNSLSVVRESNMWMMESASDILRYEHGVPAQIFKEIRDMFGLKTVSSGKRYFWAGPSLKASEGEMKGFKDRIERWAKRQLEILGSAKVEANNASLGVARVTQEAIRGFFAEKSNNVSPYEVTVIAGQTAGLAKGKGWELTLTVLSEPSIDDIGSRFKKYIGAVPGAVDRLKAVLRKIYTDHGIVFRDAAMIGISRRGLLIGGAALTSLAAVLGGYVLSRRSSPGPLYDELGKQRKIEPGSVEWNEIQAFIQAAIQDDFIASHAEYRNAVEAFKRASLKDLYNIEDPSVAAFANAYFEEGKYSHTLVGLNWPWVKELLRRPQDAGAGIYKQMAFGMLIKEGKTVLDQERRPDFYYLPAWFEHKHSTSGLTDEEIKAYAATLVEQEAVGYRAMIDHVIAANKGNPLEKIKDLFNSEKDTRIKDLLYSYVVFLSSQRLLDEGQFPIGTEAAIRDMYFRANTYVLTVSDLMGEDLRSRLNNIIIRDAKDKNAAARIYALEYMTDPKFLNPLSFLRRYAPKDNAQLSRVARPFSDTAMAVTPDKEIMQRMLRHGFPIRSLRISEVKWEWRRPEKPLLIEPNDTDRIETIHLLDMTKYELESLQRWGGNWAYEISGLFSLNVGRKNRADGSYGWYAALGKDSDKSALKAKSRKIRDWLKKQLTRWRVPSDAAMTAVDRRTWLTVLAGAVVSAVGLGAPKPTGAGALLRVVRGPKESNVVLVSHGNEPDMTYYGLFLPDFLKNPQNYTANQDILKNLVDFYSSIVRPNRSAYDQESRKLDKIKDELEKEHHRTIDSIGMDITPKELEFLLERWQRREDIKQYLKSAGINDDRMVEDIFRYVGGPGFGWAASNPGIRPVALESDDTRYSFFTITGKIAKNYKAVYDHAHAREQADQPAANQKDHARVDEFLRKVPRAPRSFKDGVMKKFFPNDDTLRGYAEKYRDALIELEDNRASRDRNIVRAMRATPGNLLAVLDPETIERTAGQLPADKGVFRADGAMLATGINNKKFQKVIARLKDIWGPAAFNKDIVGNMKEFIAGGRIGQARLMKIYNEAKRMYAEDDLDETLETTRKPVILFVGNHPQKRMMVRRLLMKVGYFVILARDTEEGLQKLEASYAKIDRVIVDFRMQGFMNGVRFVESMADRGWNKPVHVSVNSSSDHTNTTHEMNAVLGLQWPSFIGGHVSWYQPAEKLIRQVRLFSMEDQEKHPDPAPAARKVTQLYYIGARWDYKTPADMVNAYFSNVGQVHMIDPVYSGGYVAEPYRTIDVHTRAKTVKSMAGMPVELFFENQKTGTFKPPQTTGPVGYIVKVVEDSSSATAYASFYAKMIGKMKAGDYLLVKDSFLRNDILEDGRSGLKQVPAGELGLRAGAVKDGDWTVAVSLSSIMLLEIENGTPKLKTKKLPYVEDGWVVFQKQKEHDRDFIKSKLTEDAFESGAVLTFFGSGGADSFALARRRSAGKSEQLSPEEDPVAIFAGTTDAAMSAQAQPYAGKKIMVDGYESEASTALRVMAAVRGYLGTHIVKGDGGLALVLMDGGMAHKDDVEAAKALMAYIVRRFKARIAVDTGELAIRKNRNDETADLRVLAGKITAFLAMEEAEAKEILAGTGIYRFGQSSTEEGKDDKILKPENRVFNGKRVLITNVTTSTREAIRDELEAAGAKVIVAPNRAAAWEEFLNSPMDLLYTDSIRLAEEVHARSLQVKTAIWRPGMDVLKAAREVLEVLKDKRILIFHGTTSFRRQLQNTLKAEGAQASIAPNSGLAWEQLLKFPYDLVYTDSEAWAVQVRAKFPKMKIVLWSDVNDPVEAIEAQLADAAMMGQVDEIKFQSVVEKLKGMLAPDARLNEEIISKMREFIADEHATDPQKFIGSMDRSGFDRIFSPILWDNDRDIDFCLKWTLREARRLYGQKGNHDETLESTRKPVVLVADDDAIERIKMHMYLSEQGYFVIIVPDGEGALEQLEKHYAKIGVVVSDLNMFSFKEDAQHLNGAEVVREMQKRGLGKLVFIRTSDTNEAKAEMKKAIAGPPPAFFQDYVYKGESIVEKVRKVVPVDNAQMSGQAPGGIDLNTEGMGLNVRRDGNGVEMSIDPAAIERIKREGLEGLVPVIFRITPVEDIWSLAGIPRP